MAISQSYACILQSNLNNEPAWSGTDFRSSNVEGLDLNLCSF